MEKYTRSTFSSLRNSSTKMEEGGRQVDILAEAELLYHVSFSVAEYTLVHSMCRCRKLNLLGRQGASLFSSGFRRLFAKLLLRNWDEGGGVRAYRRNEFTFLSPQPPPFSFPRKEPEIYTCTNMRFLSPTNLPSLCRQKKEGRGTRKGDNSLNQKRNANASFFFFFL